MRKIILLIIFINICSIDLLAFSFSPNHEVVDEGGTLLFFSLSYDNDFNSRNKIFSLNFLEFSFLPSPISRSSMHIIFLTQFSKDISVFDIYLGLGLSLYPFKRIFSLSGNFYYGLSIFTLNHFSYIADIKANIDIPIYFPHNLSLGAGLRHRNALRIIDYFNLNNSYYKVYNCYFFEIGYRIAI